MRDAMWEWHYVFGFSLVALYLSRIFVTIQNPETKPLQLGKSKHQNMKQILYAVFYLATLFMSASGVLLYFKETLVLSKDLAELLKEAHELTMWFFVAFSAAHIIGVFVSENRDEPGIVSKMINGGKS